MQPSLFQYIANLLKNESGLSISEDKIYLIESRLQPIARQNGIDTVEDLIVQIQRTSDRTLMHEVVQSMTTNETMFFRDNKPFERLRELVMPQLTKHHPERRHIRIWCSACSTGQEPYSVAITLQEESAKYMGYSFEIFATDLCEKALDKAKSASYTQFEVQRGMPIQLLIKYFQQLEGNLWQIKDEIRQKVRFNVHNLMEDASKYGKFDIIFCRNVLIYFDEATKREVLQRLVSVMNPPGYLLLGSAETVIGLSDRLSMLTEAPGVYTLKPS